jgi:hypothetical protein
MGRLGAGILLQKPGILIPDQSVVEKVAVGLDLLRVVHFFRVSVILSVLSTYSFTTNDI